MTVIILEEEGSDRKKIERGFLGGWECYFLIQVLVTLVSSLYEHSFYDTLKIYAFSIMQYFNKKFKLKRI